jgi:hypothetical protein
VLASLYVRVQKQLGARDFTLMEHSFEIALGGLMPILVVAAGLSNVPLLLLLAPRGSVPFVAELVALLLWAGVVIVTLILNRPVNALARHGRVAASTRCLRAPSFCCFAPTPFAGRG